MRSISSKERKNGMKYCQWCKPSKVRAKWRNTGCTLDGSVKIQLACGYHKDKLVDGPEQSKSLRDNMRADGTDTGRITEADEQTWRKL